MTSLRSKYKNFVKDEIFGIMVFSLYGFQGQCAYSCFQCQLQTQELIGKRKAKSHCISTDFSAYFFPSTKLWWGSVWRKAQGMFPFLHLFIYCRPLLLGDMMQSWYFMLVSAMQSTTCVTLGNFYNLLEPQFFHISKVIIQLPLCQSLGMSIKSQMWNHK